MSYKSQSGLNQVPLYCVVINSRLAHSYSSISEILHTLTVHIGEIWHILTVHISTHQKFDTFRIEHSKILI